MSAYQNAPEPLLEPCPLQGLPAATNGDPSATGALSWIAEAEQFKQTVDSNKTEYVLSDFHKKLRPGIRSAGRE